MELVQQLGLEVQMEDVVKTQIQVMDVVGQVTRQIPQQLGKSSLISLDDETYSFV